MIGVRKTSFLSVVGLAVLLAGLVLGAKAQNLELTLWRIPTPNSLPYGIGLAADGKVYFTEFSGNKLGQLDPETNEIRERPVGPGPSGLFVSEEGGIFLALSGENAIQFLVFTGGTASWPLPTAGAWPGVLVPGSGPGQVNLWLNERLGRKVARFSPTTIHVTLPLILTPATSVVPEKSVVEPVVRSVTPLVYPGNPLLPPPIALFPATTSGPFTEWASFAEDRYVERVAVAPDGDVWFSQGEAPLCRLNPETNTVLYYGLPVGSAALALSVDAAGKVWFSDTGRAALGRLDPSTGDIVLWPVPEGRQPFALAFTPAGEVWFTDREAELVGLFHPEAGEFFLYPLPAESHPLFLVLGRDGSVWFTAERGNYVGRLAGPPLGIPPGPLAPESFSVTGYAVAQSGNKAELTISYAYDGASGLPIWLGVEVLREGQVLAGFLATPARIAAPGTGEVRMLLIYQGAGLQTSDTLRLLVFLAPDGPGTVVKEIAFRATWIP